MQLFLSYLITNYKWASNLKQHYGTFYECVAYTDVKLLHKWGARYLKVADSGPLPRSDGCGFSSSRATAAARIPMADSAGGKLE
jgi:beta-xylosidase